MPDLLTLRIVKNIIFSFVLIVLAFVIGISMSNFFMFAVPAVLAIILIAGTYRLTRRYRNGNVYVWSGTCLGSSKSFLPTRVDYAFQADTGESIVVKGRATKEFRESLHYDLLFERTGDFDEHPNLMDFTVSPNLESKKQQFPVD